MNKELKKNISIFLSFLFFGIIVFSNVFQGNFLGDDVSRILEQKEHLEQGLFHTLSYILPDRPFLMFTIWLNFKFFGLKTFSYKAINILVQILVGFFLYIFLQQLAWIHYKKKETLVPFLCGLLYMVHPIHNISIVQVIQRGTSLATLFFLLSFWTFLKFRKNKNQNILFTSLFFYVISLLSKPITVCFPLVLWAYLYFCVKEKNKYKILIPYFVLTFIPLLIHLFPHTTLDLVPVIARPHQNAFQYAFIQLGVVLKYFSIFLFPYKTEYMYAINNHPHIYNWLSYLGLFIHPLILFITLYPKRIHPLTKFFVVSMYFCYLPESSFHAIRDVMFLHRNALPSIFICALFYKFFRGLKGKYALILVPIIAMNSVFTYQRSQISKSWITWGKDFIDSNPNDAIWYERFFLSLIFNNEWSEGVKYINDLKPQEKYPQALEYKLFIEIFNTSNPPEGSDIKGLETTANILINPNYFSLMTEYTRKNLNLFAYKQLYSLLKSPDVEIKMETILYPQLELFVRTRPNYDEELMEYKRFFDVAFKLYSEKYDFFEINKQSKENPDEYLTYLRLHRLNKTLFGKEGLHLKEKFETFRKKYPRNSKIEAEYKLL